MKQPNYCGFSIFLILCMSWSSLFGLNLSPLESFTYYLYTLLYYTVLYYSINGKNVHLNLTFSNIIRKLKSYCIKTHGKICQWSMFFFCFCHKLLDSGDIFFNSSLLYSAWFQFLKWENAQHCMYSSVPQYKAVPWLTHLYHTWPLIFRVKMFIQVMGTGQGACQGDWWEIKVVHYSINQYTYCIRTTSLFILYSCWDNTGP